MARKAPNPKSTVRDSTAKPQACIIPRYSPSVGRLRCISAEAIAVAVKVHFSSALELAFSPITDRNFYDLRRTPGVFLRCLSAGAMALLLCIYLLSCP